MKLKQFILAAFVTLSVVSCTKQDIAVPQQENVPQTNAVAVTSTSIPETNNFVYVFAEPQSKQDSVVKGMKLNATTSRPFVGFNAGVGLTSSNMGDLAKYIDLPYWYNGVLPSVVQSEIPQTTGGSDSYGNPILKYNFKTVKFSKNTLNQNVWFTFLVPVSAMNNDIYKQQTIEYSYKNNNVTYKTSLLMESSIYSYVINYQGTHLPKGSYRVYTTFVKPALRISCNQTDDIYFRGNVAR